MPYDNTFSCDHTFRFCNLRGGTHIFYNNKFTTRSGSPTTIQLKNEGVSTYGSYNSKDELKNCFFWNNTLNGATTRPDIETGSDAYVLEGRNYFNRAPQQGDPIYPYTPFVYPHPFVTAQDGGSTSTNPVIALSPNSRNFGSIAAGTTNDLTFTVQNVGGGTLTGSAAVSSPFSIIGSSSYSLAANASQTITVRFKPVAAGTFNNTVAFSGGGGATASVSGSAWTGSPPLSFNPPDGTITGPFELNADNTISQTAEIDDPVTAGRVVFNFSIPTAGDYGVTADVVAPDDSSNSFFANIDSEPISPDMIWDIPVDAGLVTRPMTWRGSGAVNGATEAQRWTLAAGAHQLIICGREANVKLGRVNIVPVPKPPSNLRIVVN